MSREISFVLYLLLEHTQGGIDVVISLTKTCMAERLSKGSWVALVAAKQKAELDWTPPLAG